MKIKKILIGMILGISSFISQASPTDCRQLAEDGEVDCIKVDSFYSNSTQDGKFSSFDEAALFFGEKLCNFYIKNNAVDVCYLQYPEYPNYPPEGRNSCSSNCDHSLFTGPILNNSKYLPFKYGVYSTVYYSTDPKKSNLKGYGKTDFYIYKYGFCTQGMIDVYAYIENEPQKYCKPNPIPQNNPTSCDTNCNVSSGNVSIGN